MNAPIIHADFTPDEAYFSREPQYAAQHLLGLSPVRRAELEAEWDDLTDRATQAAARETACFNSYDHAGFQEAVADGFDAAGTLDAMGRVGL